LPYPYFFYDRGSSKVREIPSSFESNKETGRQNVEFCPETSGTPDAEVPEAQRAASAYFTRKLSSRELAFGRDRTVRRCHGQVLGIWPQYRLRSREMGFLRHMI
jgi:hypothetical protein